MDPTTNIQGTPPFEDSRLPAIDCGATLHCAAEYFNRGWSVLPLLGKRPAVPSWRKYQEGRASIADLRRWFTSDAVNLGIVTGALSGLVIVDCDTPSDAEFWQRTFPQTPLAVATGRGGRHYYYRYPIGEDVFNRAGLLTRHIDLRAQGGYVVAPPSRHPNGTQYSWLESDDFSLEQVPYFSPEWIAQGVLKQPAQSTNHVRHPRSYIRSIYAVSGQGGHNQTFRATCKLRDAGLSPEEALCELVNWNQSNASPPWSDYELLHKVRSAYQNRIAGMQSKDDSG